MCKTDIINFNKEISQNNIKSKNPDILLKKINLINYGYENILINNPSVYLKQRPFLQARNRVLFVFNSHKKFCMFWLDKADEPKLSYRVIESSADCPICALNSERSLVFYCRDAGYIVYPSKGNCSAIYLIYIC